MSVKRPFKWGPSWGGAAIGGVVAGAAVGGTVNNIWQGLKNGLGSGSDYDGGQASDDETIIIVPYPYSAPHQSNGYAPSGPQFQNGPQWQNNPQSQNGPQGFNDPQNQNGPQWQNSPPPQPPQPPQQKQPTPPAQQQEQEPEATFEDISHPTQATKMKPLAGMSVTLSLPVVCRKFPDTIASTSSQNVYAGGSRVFVNCWTTASMPGEAGKVDNSPIWLKTDRGCYISDSSTEEMTDFQSKLPFCVAPPHWVAPVQKQYEAKLDCYQCPTLKCPNSSIGKSKTVDVQCLVDGEDARGNSTWVKPVDQNCYLPAEIFTREGWFGKFDILSQVLETNNLTGTASGKC